MREARLRSASLTAGIVTLAVLAALAVVGPAIEGGDPELALDPGATALAPPGTRFETLKLTAGYELAAERIERDGDVFRLEGPHGTRRIAADTADPARPLGARRFWLGTDALGRDVAARLLAGARVSLTVGIAAVALSLAVGVPLGLLAGLAHGIGDRTLLGTIESAQAFPRLFLLVALVAVVPAGVTTTVLVLGLSGWMPIARFVRAETRKIRGSDYVLAARSAGVSPFRLARRHLLPNVAAPVAIEASLAMAAAVTTEAALSFLGLGVPPPVPSWGNLIADGRELAASAWWISLFPGLALVATVLACGLIGDALRDRLDPHAASPAG